MRASTPDFESVGQFIRQEMVQESVPGLAVAAARDGEILWEEGFGWADREKRLDATPHTPFSLASISKPITATAVMMLQEQGKLDVDRPANDYLGDAKIRAYVGDAKNATIRRLANHTSGLPTHYHFFYEDEPYRRPAMDETIRRYGILVTPPGERRQYSNLGYGILDEIVRRVSGVSFTTFLRRELFLPLGMVRSSLDIGPGLEPFAATRYGGDGVPYPFYDFDHPGGSAVFCSAHDLLRFGMFHLQTPLADQKAILSGSSIEAMQRSTFPGDSPRGYGFGWAFNEDEQGHRSVNHGGGMMGVSTLLALYPDEKIAIVSLANRSCELAYRLVPEIAAVMMPAYRERLEAEKRRENEDKEKPKAPEAAFRTPRALLGDWEGFIHTYEGDRPLNLSVLRGGQIHARLDEGPEALVNRPDWKDGRLGGLFVADLQTADVDRRPYHLHLDLKRRGRVLNGAILAMTTSPRGEGGAPGRRGGYCLAHWAELKRTRSR